jgi:hypothetical protein
MKKRLRIIRNPFSHSAFSSDLSGRFFFGERGNPFLSSPEEEALLNGL